MEANIDVQSKPFSDKILSMWEFFVRVFFYGFYLNGFNWTEDEATEGRLTSTKMLRFQEEAQNLRAKKRNILNLLDKWLVFQKLTRYMGVHERIIWLGILFVR